MLAEVHFDAQILHHVAGDHAADEPLLESFFDGRHEVAGNHAADDRVDPQEVVLLVVVVVLQLRKAALGGVLLDVRAARQRVHADMDLAELPAAAGLFLVPIAAFGIGLDRLAERDLGFLGFDFQFVAPLQSFADDLQVQLAHARDHQFLGLRVAIEPEGRIFFDDLVQGAGQLRFVAAALGRDGQADHGRGILRSAAAGSRRAPCRCGVPPSWPRPRCRLGRPDSIGCGLFGLNLQQRPDLDALAGGLAGTVSSFFSVPEKTRMKLSFCTNGSMRVLKTWATSGPAGSGTISALLAVFAAPCGAASAGDGAQATSASISS